MIRYGFGVIALVCLGLAAPAVSRAADRSSASASLAIVFPFDSKESKLNASDLALLEFGVRRALFFTLETEFGYQMRGRSAYDRALVESGIELPLECDVDCLMAAAKKLGAAIYVVSKVSSAADRHTISMQMFETDGGARMFAENVSAKSVSDLRQGIETKLATWTDRVATELHQRRIEAQERSGTKLSAASDRSAGYGEAKWGASPNQVRKLFPGGYFLSEKSGETSYSVAQFLPAISRDVLVSFAFSSKGQLHTVTILVVRPGTRVDPEKGLLALDMTPTEAEESWASLATALRRKYGAPQEETQKNIAWDLQDGSVDLRRTPTADGVQVGIAYLSTLVSSTQGL